MDDELHKEWNKNTRDNMPLFKKENSIWRLDFKYYGENEKAMIIVGSSPCLARDVKKLKEADDDFIIVCANSALKFLLAHGVTPHYCVCVDADHIDIPKHLDVKGKGKNITLLASTVVCREALDAWQGPIYFLPYLAVEKDLRRKIYRRLGRMVPSGGNSITSAFYTVSVIFGSRTVIFVGNEYCFDKVKNYYADTKASKQEKLKTIFPITDALGKQRWTLPAHFNYAKWTERVCNDLSPKGYFIDTSFGLLGADCANIHIMNLSDALKRVKWSFDVKRKLNRTKSEKQKLKIIGRIKGNDEPSQVFRYNVSEHHQRILQLARS